MKASIPVVTTIALVCLPKVACGCDRSAPSTFAVAAKNKSPRANAKNAAMPGISMCKMQTALIPHDLIAVHKLEYANGNALRDQSTAICNKRRAAALEASGPLSTRMLVEQLPGETLG
jgi:hypothetical protein